MIGKVFRMTALLMWLGGLVPATAAGEEEDAVVAGTAGRFWERVEAGGLIEIGGGYRSFGASNRASDIQLTTAELGLGVGLNRWIRADLTFLYENPAGCEPGGFGLDSAFVTFRDEERFPLWMSVGKLYVPFGALLTRFPDDPAVDQPMTLLLGETSEETVAAGWERSGLSVKGYLFGGEMRVAGNRAFPAFGVDVRYEAPAGEGVDVMAGASYISNVADSDCLTETISDNVKALEKSVGGFALYGRIGFRGLFATGEFITALGSFRAGELARADGRGARPSAWNIEAGYRWERFLEIVLKVAGSGETEAIGLPRRRLGLGLNRDLGRNVTASFALLGDRFHPGDVDGKDRGLAALGQVAVRF